MGLFKSLFGGKNDKPKLSMSIQTNTASKTAKVGSKVQDLVLLSLADKYKVGEKKYPSYLREKYGIGFPEEKLQDLYAKGYIRPATAIESLFSLKLSELKDIATAFGLKSSGKKDELCARIAESVTEVALQGRVNERNWIVTDSGRELLEKNHYIAFYMEKHPYSLEAVGLDINSYSKLFSTNPNGRVRDVLWGEFNRRSLDYYQKAMTKGDFRDYCDLLRTMSLFVEEEERHADALALYMRYIFYRSNFEAGLKAINTYAFLKRVQDAAETLYINSELYPFIADELLQMSNSCGYDSVKLQTYMVGAFSREQDSGVFSAEELSQFVMSELNGDKDNAQKICLKVMKSASKKIPKRK